MPPRRSAAAGEDQGPTLKLIVEKGPLSGTTREFKPGKKVQIGRLVRGNSLTIRDAGISSNHLLIQAEEAPEPDGRRWTISDLDSSNGTILNGARLEPFETTALSHGDVIKIGELTSITVEIVSGADNEVGSGMRRNPRRRVREQPADLGVIDEFAELGLQNNVDEEKIEVEAKQGRNANTRKTRNSAKNENLAKGLNIEEVRDLGPSGIKGSRVLSTRSTRSSRKEENIDEIAVDLSVIEGKKTTRGGGRVKKLFVETTCEDTEKEEQNLAHETREEEKEGSEIDLNVIEGKKMTRGRGRGRQKLFVETICEETEKEEPNPQHAEEKERSEIRADVLKNSGTEGVAAEATTSSVESGKGKGKMVADLEKMTLGEWLDYLAVYEPQQIIAETEEMLAEMRQKAEMCHEFMLQQKKKVQGS
ncbi:FHA domain-containing protein At4g14490 [Salvia miltiorrhiza]|uniref:FHA domain-containing protein At4g14490 n=1 Tax=Salvia miltiorrhiza TaxID=226208 RepID=UPI0025AC02D9|nr:FHA domain-containing protein At4g14490 [Salvia miltiorrhiza]